MEQRRLNRYNVKFMRDVSFKFLNDLLDGCKEMVDKCFKGEIVDEYYLNAEKAHDDKGIMNKLKKVNAQTNSLSLYLEAFKLKFFPISLTIISTALGFIPFVYSGQNEVFWFALGVGTIGGLLFSFLAILIYLPLFSIKKR